MARSKKQTKSQTKMEIAAELSAPLYRRARGKLRSKQPPAADRGHGSGFPS